MLRAVPPFRADHVRSLLRPQPLKDARAQVSAGEIPAQQLRETEDRAIREVIAKQESIGLEGITDGEFRRTFWHLDFLEHLSGVESYQACQRLEFSGGPAKVKGIKVTSKIRAGLHPMIEHFKFLKANTSKDSQDHHSVAQRASLSGRPQSRERERLPRHGRVLLRSGPGL